MKGGTLVCTILAQHRVPTRQENTLLSNLKPPRASSDTAGGMEQVANILAGNT